MGTGMLWRNLGGNCKELFHSLFSRCEIANDFRWGMNRPNKRTVGSSGSWLKREYRQHEGIDVRLISFSAGRMTVPGWLARIRWPQKLIVAQVLRGNFVNVIARMRHIVIVEIVAIASQQSRVVSVK
jgi:hypothetical protein